MNKDIEERARELYSKINDCAYSYDQFEGGLPSLEFYGDSSEVKELMAIIAQALTAAEAKGRAEGLEEAAKEIDSLVNGLGEDSLHFTMIGGCQVMIDNIDKRAEYGRYFATAIRNMKEK